jgi:formamidopyrimidine-DNA glycosylase
MPELPEVETVVRDLRPLVVGRVISAVIVGKEKLRRPWQPRWTKQIVGKRVATINRRGKWILIDLGDPVLIIHLGMTGQLTVVPSDEPKADHTHLVFELDDGNDLRFRDVRRFGSADLFTREEAEQFLKDRLGPEPFDLDPVAFQSSVRSSIRSLKAILLDQSVVAGVGNIYADEACFLSSLHPARRGTTLTPAECDRLRESIVDVLKKAIAGRGSTIRDYVGGSGLMGTYQGEFRVYGRTGEACTICTTKIEMVRLAGRSSHFCPTCQGRGPRRRKSIQ